MKMSKLINDGGSFERILKDVEEAANGDESRKINLLTRIIVQELIQKQVASKFDNLGFYIPKRRRGSVTQILPARMPLPPQKKINLKRCFDLTKNGSIEDEQEVIRKPKKQKKKNVNHVQQERIVADMPDSFKTRIQEENGTEIVLVMQKQLTESDLDSDKNRLSIPRTKMRYDQFLNEKEKSIIDANPKQGIKVLLIPPSLKENVTLKLKRWKMGDNYIYNLIENWSKLVVKDKDNGLLEEDVTVQLWSFRNNSSDLCFALVKC